jgi:hypothetical protein
MTEKQNVAEFCRILYCMAKQWGSSTLECISCFSPLKGALKRVGMNFVKVHIPPQEGTGLSTPLGSASSFLTLCFMLDSICLRNYSALSNLRTNGMLRMYKGLSCQADF